MPTLTPVSFCPETARRAAEEEAEALRPGTPERDFSEYTVGAGGYRTRPSVMQAFTQNNPRTPPRAHLALAQTLELLLLARDEGAIPRGPAQGMGRGVL